MFLEQKDPSRHRCNSKRNRGQSTGAKKSEVKVNGWGNTLLEMEMVLCRLWPLDQNNEQHIHPQGRMRAAQCHARRSCRPRDSRGHRGKSTKKQNREQKRGKPEDTQCSPTLTAPCEFRWMDDDVCRMQHVGYLPDDERVVTHCFMHGKRKSNAGETRWRWGWMKC